MSVENVTSEVSAGRRAAGAQRMVPTPRPRARPLRGLGLLRALRTNPIAAWTQRHYEEPVVLRRTILGPICVISDPAAIKYVLVDNARNYRKGVLQRRVLRPGLGNGLLTAEGESWREQRRALAPVFTPRVIDGFRPAMAEAAARLIARWRVLPQASQLDAAREMSHVTLEVLERTIFSDGLASEPARLAGAVRQYLDTLGRIHPFDALDLPDWVPRLGRKNNPEPLGIFAATIEAMIARRRALLAQGATAPADLLTLLLKAESEGELGPDEVKANIATFIAAGHETTANTLTWSLFLLSFAPSWRTSLEAEVDAVFAGAARPFEMLDRLVVTKAVVEEALRLYPPAATITRQPLRPDVIATHEVGPRTRIVISPWILHRHRRLWDRPESFDPSRFLPRARAGIGRFAYLPFGAGPRICIGASFALQEAVILLAAMARHFRLDLVPGYEVRPVQRVTLRPAGGLPMILRHRR